jgi:hypothetical protein
MRCDEKSGDYLNTDDNITEMFEFLNENCELLEKHQQDFIESLESQFLVRGFLSIKQFKWLVRYYTIVDIDLSGAYGEFDNDWRDGHPLDFGDM